MQKSLGVTYGFLVAPNWTSGCLGFLSLMRATELVENKMEAYGDWDEDITSSVQALVAGERVLVWAVLAAVVIVVVAADNEGVG